MATPITNNNAQNLLRGADSPALAGNNKTLRPEAQGLVPGQAAVDIVATESQEQGMTVSRAAQLLSQQPAERGAGAIQSADQAQQLAKGLRALFEGNGGQALAAQAGNTPADLMGLLQAG